MNKKIFKTMMAFGNREFRQNTIVDPKGLQSVLASISTQKTHKKWFYMFDEDVKNREGGE